MKYYVCIENNKVVSIINYEPNVPNTVTIIVIEEEDYSLITKGTHYFSVEEKKVTPIPSTILNKVNNLKKAQEIKAKLLETDFAVMRHIREKTLKKPTTMTEEDYIKLEEERYELDLQIQKLTLNT